jgi:hypothetical protein
MCGTTCASGNLCFGESLALICVHGTMFESPCALIGIIPRVIVSYREVYRSILVVWNSSPVQFLIFFVGFNVEQ